MMIKRLLVIALLVIMVTGLFAGCGEKEEEAEKDWGFLPVEKVEIKVNEGDLVISLNGTVVSTVKDCELTEGPIGFQSEGAATRWRNIRIKKD